MTNEPPQKAADGNSSTVQKPAQSVADKAAWLVLGSGISTAFGIAFFVWQRGRQAKDHYLVTFSQLSGELDRHSNALFFYQESLSRVQEAVFRLRPFLRKTKAGDLSRLWNLYRDAHAILQQADEGHSWDQRFYDYFGATKPKNRKEIIQLFHKKFTEIAE